MQRSAKELKQRIHWESMKEQGHIPYVLQCILTLIGSSVLVDLAHLSCSKLGNNYLDSTTDFRYSFDSGGRYEHRTKESSRGNRILLES
jgi:hypothetical protein